MGAAQAAPVSAYRQSSCRANGTLRLRGTSFHGVRLDKMVRRRRNVALEAVAAAQGPRQHRSPFRAPSVQDCRCRLAAVSDELMQGGAEIRDTPCALSDWENFLTVFYHSRNVMSTGCVPCTGFVRRMTPNVNQPALRVSYTAADKGSPASSQGVRLYGSKPMCS